MGLSWERIKHDKCGEVTTMQFWFGYKSSHVSPIPTGIYPDRTLGDILSSASKQFQKEAPLLTRELEYEGPNAFKRINVADIYSFVRCPSVFTSTRWCDRKLSLKEIAECFDQTYDIVEEIANLGISKKLLLFVKGVPNKITQHVLRRLNLLDLNKEKDDLVRVNNKTGFRSDIVVPPMMDDNVLTAVKADDALIENFYSG